MASPQIGIAAIPIRDPALFIGFLTMNPPRRAVKVILSDEEF
jgi:hypothetical protein